MIRFIQFILFIFLLIFLYSCNGQTKNDHRKEATIKKVGGGCDGCELMYIGMPTGFHSVDTSAGWKEAGQKLLVTGKLYKIDRVTPASNVIIYYWHTDKDGYYSSTPGMNEKAKRHGHIRGWVKSDLDGSYSIYTSRPGVYPNRDIPAHIHIAIKEPDINNEYYIDELVFKDDTLLTAGKVKALENRGGSGILRVSIVNDLQVAKHNIILGLNIPGYPKPEFNH